MKVMQGDQYNISIHLKIDNAEVDISAIEKIQFKIGNLMKVFIPNSQDTEVTYDDNEHLFYFPLTEEETYGFNSTTAICEVRIKFVGDVIKGARFTAVPIEFASITERMGE